MSEYIYKMVTWDDLLYEKCERCGKYIKHPIENMRKVGLLVGFLCCDDCVEKYIKKIT